MSDVTPRAARDDLIGAFKTYWDASAFSSVPLAYPNLPFDPEDAGEANDAAWVRIFIVGDLDAGQTRLSNSVARNHWIRSGTITFEVYVREGAATDRVYGLVDAIALWMEDPGLSFVFLNNMSAPVEIGPDGTWFQVSISADWRYFTDRAA